MYLLGSSALSLWADIEAASAHLTETVILLPMLPQRDLPADLRLSALHPGLPASSRRCF